MRICETDFFIRIVGSAKCGAIFVLLFYAEAEKSFSKKYSKSAEYKLK